jgi:hypothetical protein
VDGGSCSKDNGNNNDVDNNDDDDGMIAMRWRHQQWGEDTVMAMGSLQRTKHPRALWHPSEATINLCQQFGEESTRERDNFGGLDGRKGSRWRQLGGDHFFISPPSVAKLLPV